MQAGEEVLLLGDLDERIVRLWTEHVAGDQQVVLTRKQRQHYLTRHPETAALENLLAETVLHPDEVHRNRYDPAMAILYWRTIEGRYVRVAVLMQKMPTALKHSVLSYRTAGRRELERGRRRLAWRRE